MNVPIPVPLRSGLFLLGCFFCFIPFDALPASHWVRSKNIQQAQSQLFRLHFSSAALALNQEKNADPDNRWIPVLEAEQSFITAFVNGSSTSRESFLTQVQELDLDGFSDYPDAGYAAAELSLFKCLLHLRFHAPLSAAWELHRCHRLISSHESRFSNYLPNSLVKGAVLSILGAVPESYTGLLRMIGLEGDLIKGRTMLSAFIVRCGTTPYSSQLDEALFALTTIQTTLTPDSPPEHYMDSLLLVRQEENMLLRNALVGWRMKQRRNDDALLLLNSPVDTGASIRIPVWQYRKGLAIMRKESSCTDLFFRQYITQHPSGDWVKSSWQKIAWLALLRGDTLNYRSAISRAQSEGLSWLDEDKEALSEAQSRMIPNVQLLKSRLLYDGGYYAEAVRMMARIPMSDLRTSKDRIEYVYRLARLFQAQGRTDQAVIHYRRVMELGRNQTWYFAANSALLLGEIMEQRQELSQSAAYYEQCLSMRHHDYQNSIDQKAKAGLRRVQK